ncbi:unnamed protein product [Amoebophrya sp. A25]|nr:unnamed protein product [Amoebophrya sp. A25]|eukprot:GSA25T00014593001.1
MTADDKKTEDVEMKDTTAPPKPEEPEEKEGDAVADKRARVDGDSVGFSIAGASIGACIFSGGGASNNILNVRQEAATLINGTKLSVGLKSGRYLTEFRCLDRFDKCKIGVTTKDTPVVMEVAVAGGTTGGVVTQKKTEEAEEEAPKPLATRVAFDPSGYDIVYGTEIRKRPAKYATAKKGDILGLLLNLDSKLENKGTISLFVNGVRCSEPVELPAIEGAVWYPTLSARGTCAFAVNVVKEAWKPLPFVCRTVADASKADAALPAKSANDFTGEAIVLCGADPSGDCAEKYAATKPDHVLLSTKALNEMAKDSGAAFNRESQTYNVDMVDSVRGGPILASIASVTPRKCLFSLNSGMTETERAGVLKNFVGGSVKAVVLGTSFEERVDGQSYYPEHISSGKNISLPSKSEGFDSVEFFGATEAATKKKFEGFKERMEMRSKLETLQTGDFYRKYVEEYEKVRTLMHRATAPKKDDKKDPVDPTSVDPMDVDKKPSEKKKDAEGEANADEAAEKEEKKDLPVMESFSEEDWMLALLRAELHGLLHAFEKDAGGRKGFVPSLLNHYYKLYSGKMFYHTVYGVSKIEQIVDLVPEVCEIKDALLVSKLPDAYAPEDLVALTEQARLARKDRIDAGDDTAALKFVADTSAGKGKKQTPYAQYGASQKGMQMQGKGGKGPQQYGGHGYQSGYQRAQPYGQQNYNQNYHQGGGYNRYNQYNQQSYGNGYSQKTYNQNYNNYNQQSRTRY